MAQVLIAEALPNDFDMDWRSFCGNLKMSTLDGCDGKKRIEFHSSSGVMAERHVSTPWRRRS
jgi:hypothetical protein